MSDLSDTVIVGKITVAFGIQGWVKVHSFTSPSENIFQFPALYLQDTRNTFTQVQVSQYRTHQKGFVAKFAHIKDRNMAEQIAKQLLVVERTALTETNDNEYYWHDLVGLKVYNTKTIYLGEVSHLFETGANDVLVVRDGEKERLLPFVLDIHILNIDLDEGKMVVEWEEDF